MRTVHIPIPQQTARLVVRKPRSEHMIADELTNGRRDSASDAFSDRLVHACQAALDADAANQKTPWSVLWFAHRVRGWYGFKRAEEVEFACSGPDGGVALRDHLVHALNTEPVDLAVGKPSAGMPSDAFPSAARWGEFTFGPAKLRRFGGLLVAMKGTEAPDPRPTPPLVCPSCGHMGSPVWKVIGYPDSQLLRLEEALTAHWGSSEMDFLGCIPPESPYGPASCRACNIDLFPATETPEAIAEYVLQREPLLEPGFNKVYAGKNRTGAAVWVGRSKLINGVASFVLHPSMLQYLHSLDWGLLALQMESGAVLFTDVGPLIAATSARERGRPRLRVPLHDPLARSGRCDGHRISLRAGWWQP